MSKCESTFDFRCIRSPSRCKSFEYRNSKPITTPAQSSYIFGNESKTDQLFHTSNMPFKSASSFSCMKRRKSCPPFTDTTNDQSSFHLNQLHPVVSKLHLLSKTSFEMITHNTMQMATPHLHTIQELNQSFPFIDFQEIICCPKNPLSENSIGQHDQQPHPNPNHITHSATLFDRDTNEDVIPSFGTNTTTATEPFCQIVYNTVVSSLESLIRVCAVGVAFALGVKMCVVHLKCWTLSSARFFLRLLLCHLFNSCFCFARATSMQRCRLLIERMQRRFMTFRVRVQNILESPIIINNQPHSFSNNQLELSCVQRWKYCIQLVSVIYSILLWSVIYIKHTCQKINDIFKTHQFKCKQLFYVFQSIMIVLYNTCFQSTTIISDVSHTDKLDINSSLTTQTNNVTTQQHYYPLFSASHVSDTISVTSSTRSYCRKRYYTVSTPLSGQSFKNNDNNTSVLNQHIEDNYYDLTMRTPPPQHPLDNDDIFSSQCWNNTSYPILRKTTDEIFGWSSSSLSVTSADSDDFLMPFNDTINEDSISLTDVPQLNKQQQSLSHQTTDCKNVQMWETTNQSFIRQTAPVICES